MALNFTVSYTFSPNTTISSSQVNTNTSDVANVFNGLEAETKTLAKLKVDIDPTAALNVATKQYVDHYSTYRRPVLQYSSATVVNLETGINGTSGQAQILFPDGSIRTDSTATRINFDITRNCALSGTAQSGLRATLSEATNTWYALYAVKVSDSSTNFVVVGDILLPLISSFSTLNTNFGASSWVYLGMIRNGDNSGATGDILKFIQAGHMTLFRNICASPNSTYSGVGTHLANASTTTTTAWTYASGTGTTSVPDHVLIGLVQMVINPGGAGGILVRGKTGPYNLSAKVIAAAEQVLWGNWSAVADGFDITGPASSNFTIYFAGFVDSVLGVGANPIL